MVDGVYRTDDATHAASFNVDKIISPVVEQGSKIIHLDFESDGESDFRNLRLKYNRLTSFFNRDLVQLMQIINNLQYVLLLS